MPKKKNKTISQKEALDKLLENNVILQDKTADILSEVKTLVKRIDRLLDLFEGAADFLAEKRPEYRPKPVERAPEREVEKVVKEAPKEDHLSRKLDEVIESNKQLARSLASLGRQMPPPAGAPQRL